MASVNLNGIPISDEQCIGDSLATINSAFLGLSSTTNLTDQELTRLTNAVRSLSTTNITTTTLSAFTLSPIHDQTIVLCNNTVPLTITPQAGATFNPRHQTVFIQIGSGKVIFGNGFNTLNGNTAIAGRFGVVTARYPSSTINWILDGDLKSATEPPTFLSLVAAPPPGAEDSNNNIGFTGLIADTLYYYPEPGTSNVAADPMDVYVNGFYRTTVDFEEDRIGTDFGYKVAGSTSNGPQFTGKFKEGRIDINIDGGNPVFRSLVATPTPGTVSGDDRISITGNKADTIYFYDLPPATSVLGTYMDIYVNGFYRTTIDFTPERIGTNFGYRIEEVSGTTAQVIGQFIDGAAGGPGFDFINFNIPGASTPAATDTVASTAGTENPELKITFIAQTPSFTDTVAVFPWPGQSIVPVEVNIKVDGTLRTTIQYTQDRNGDKFWYRRAGVGGSVYEFEGTFPLNAEPGVTEEINFTTGAVLPTATPTPTPVPTATPKPTATPEPTPTTPPPTTPTLFYLTAKPSAQGGTEDGLNAISIGSVVLTNEYNDTLSYSEFTLTSIIPASPMDVYVNGVLRTIVDFPEARLGSSFGYKLAGTNTTLRGTFASGRVDLNTAIQPTPTPTPTPVAIIPVLGTFDFSIVAANDVDGTFTGDGLSPNDDVTFGSIFKNDIFFGKSSADPKTGTTNLMSFTVNGSDRGVISYDSSRENDQFGFRLSTATGPLTAQRTSTLVNNSNPNFTI
jgi:hypothetical protein